MQTQAIETTITSRKSTHRRRELTVSAVAALLRYDADTNELHWLKAPKGKRPNQTRAGCEIRRNGKVAGRVLSIDGTRYREKHVVHLLQNGTWPTSKRTAKRTRKASTSAAIETPIAAVTAVTSAPIAAARPTPALVVPRQLPELSRAVIAAAPRQQRGWLTGLGLALARR